jgi:hypothetical protein
MQIKISIVMWSNSLCKTLGHTNCKNKNTHKIIYKQLTACYHDYAKQEAEPRHMLQPQAHQLTSSQTVHRMSTVRHGSSRYTLIRPARLTAQAPVPWLTPFRKCIHHASPFFFFSWLFNDALSIQTYTASVVGATLYVRTAAVTLPLKTDY